MSRFLLTSLLRGNLLRIPMWVYEILENTGGVQLDFVTNPHVGL